jgi:hypothetical protein
MGVMAQRPIPSIRWRGPSKSAEPPVNEINEAVDAAFASFRADAADELANVTPLFHKALDTARTGVITAVRRAARLKKKRQTKLKMAIASKFSALNQRIKKYYLGGEDGNSALLALRLELLEADITEKLLLMVGDWHA